jgi:uncharacterized membrane protein YgcG
LALSIFLLVFLEDEYARLLKSIFFTLSLTLSMIYVTLILPRKADKVKFYFMREMFKIFYSAFTGFVIIGVLFVLFEFYLIIAVIGFLIITSIIYMISIASKIGIINFEILGEFTRIYLSFIVGGMGMIFLAFFDVSLDIGIILCWSNLYWISFLLMPYNSIKVNFEFSSGGGSSSFGGSYSGGGFGGGSYGGGSSGGGGASGSW